MAFRNLIKKAQSYYNNLENDNKNSILEEWYELPSSSYQIKAFLLPDNKAEMKFRMTGEEGDGEQLYIFEIPNGGARRKKYKSKRNKRRTKRNKSRRNKKYM